MNYFNTLYKQQCNKLEIDAPLFLKETAIIKDTVDNEVLLRNTFFNLCDVRITAIQIEITLTDFFGNPLLVDGKKKYQYIYEDILSEPHEKFGNKISIALPAEARKAEVTICKAVFIDGQVWSSNPDDIVYLQNQKELEYDKDTIRSLDTNEIQPVFFYVENDSCWQCTCGQPNKKQANNCRYCGRSKDSTKTIYNPDYIRSFQLKTAYESAIDFQQKARTANDFSRAKELFIALGNYDDAPSRAHACDEEIHNLNKLEDEKRTATHKLYKKYLKIALAISALIMAAVIIISSIPKATDIDVTYDGKTNAGIVLGDDNSGIHVSAIYDNGKTKPVSNWTIKESKKLEAGETTTVVIDYKKLSKALSVECSTSKRKKLHAEYNGSLKNGTVITKSDIDVSIEYEDGSKKELTSGWSMKPSKVVLERGTTSSATISCGSFTKTLNFTCEDITIYQFVEDIKDELDGYHVEAAKHNEMDVVKVSVEDTNIINDLTSAKNGNKEKKDKWESIKQNYIEVSELIADRLKKSNLEDWHVEIEVYNNGPGESLLSIVDSKVVYDYVES